MIYYFNDEGKDIIVKLLSELSCKVRESKCAMQSSFSDINENRGYNIESSLEILNEISFPSDSLLERDLELARIVIEDVSNISEKYDNKAENETYDTSNNNNSEGGHSSGGGHHDIDAGKIENIFFDVSQYYKPYEEIYSQIPESKKQEYFKYCLDRWLAENPNYTSKIDPNFRNVLSQCQGVYDDKGNFCYVYKNGNETRYFKWCADGIREFSPGYEINNKNVGQAVNDLMNGRINYDVHTANGNTVYTGTDGFRWIVHPNEKVTDHWIQSVNSGFAGGGNECTATALAQTDNLNGGSRVPRDFNRYLGYEGEDIDGTTMIRFEQSSGVDIKRRCEENLSNGQATCIYYNYSWNAHGDAGYQGHCVTVCGTRNPGSTNIEDLIVIDPATGAMISITEACNFPTGEDVNFYFAYPTV